MVRALPYFALLTCVGFKKVSYETASGVAAECAKHRKVLVLLEDGDVVTVVFQSPDGA